MKTSSAPAPIVNSAAVVKSRPSTGTVLWRTTSDGPAMARIPKAVRKRVTQGMTSPYSKRNASSKHIETVPRSPRTIRTTEELAPPIGMKSISRAAPSSVSKSVSRIIVPGR